MSRTSTLPGTPRTGRPPPSGRRPHGQGGRCLGPAPLHGAPRHFAGCRCPAKCPVTTFQDLPLAERDREWDGSAAEKRVREWAGAADEPNATYRDAHVWYDADAQQNFGSYKLLVADVIDGRLKAVPRGVMAAGNV